MRLVPPRGSVWVMLNSSHLSKSGKTVPSAETHPLPRGGTGFIPQWRFIPTPSLVSRWKKCQRIRMSATKATPTKM